VSSFIDRHFFWLELEKLAFCPFTCAGFLASPVRKFVFPPYKSAYNLNHGRDIVRVPFPSTTSFLNFFLPAPSFMWRAELFHFLMASIALLHTLLLRGACSLGSLFGQTSPCPVYFSWKTAVVPYTISPPNQFPSFSRLPPLASCFLIEKLTNFFWARCLPPKLDVHRCPRLSPGSFYGNLLLERLSLSKTPDNMNLVGYSPIVYFWDNVPTPIRYGYGSPRPSKDFSAPPHSFFNPVLELFPTGSLFKILS